VHVALFSRQLSDVSAAFPELVEAAAAGQPGAGIVLDGEIVPVHPETGAVQPFQALQPRLGRRKDLDALRASNPVAFVAYDVLVAGGRPVLDQPLRARRGHLEWLTDTLGVRPAPQVRATAADLDALFDAARARGNEGLMCKRLDSPYRPGKRGRDWLKVKRALATLDVVVTAVEVGSGKRRHLLSDFTFAVRAGDDDPTLLNVGKAYSGLTDAELSELTTHFEAHTLQTFAHGRVRTVEPNVVIEVAFDRVQPSKRHRSGFALRFPRIVRLRPDKPVAEIDTLDAVRRLAEGGA
jgi:DNA ligase 1